MSPVMTRQDELWKEDTGGTIRCHECDWTGQADTIADAIALVRKHYDDAHDGAPAEPNDYELLASVLRKFSKAGYFHLWHEEAGWADDTGGWHFTIDTGIGLTDEEADAVQRALQIESTDRAGGGL